MIDASIPLGVQTAQFDTPLDHAQRAATLSQIGMQNRFMQSKMDEQQRAATLSQTMQKAYADSGGDKTKFRNTLASLGLHNEVAALDKSSLEEEETRGKIGAQQAALGDKFKGLRSNAAQFIASGGTLQHVQLAARDLMASGDKEAASHLLDMASQHPDATPEQIRAYVQPFIAQGVSAKDYSMPNMVDTGQQLTDTNPFTQSAPIAKQQTLESLASNQVSMRGQDLSAQTAREGHGVTMRGQNMTDSRAKDANAITQANAPKLTEIQSKGQLYGNRAQASHKIITELEGKYSPMAVNAKMALNDTPLIGGAGGYIANSLLSENGQKVEQAQRDFVNAVLRQESGAVISEPEFRNAQKQYFPQPGDTKAVLKQKKANREIAIKGFDVMSGPAGGFAKPVSSGGGGGGAKFLGFE